mmetsp:Transcript_88830/g.248635  ORF Transcript_88830/g.248635 Transcript_88830/m.248635 type:complete len:382 (+) Transcript_88830:112-1257(+)
MGACGSSTPCMSRAEPPCASKNAPLAAWRGSDLDASLSPHAEKRTVGGPWDGAARRDFGYVCRKGVKPRAATPNQDSWCLSSGDGVEVYGVFDGHGQRGHLVSHFAREALMESVPAAARSSMDDAGIAGRVQGCFHQVHRAMCKRPRLGPTQSGTTATVVVRDILRERLVVAHVGDSTAVLLSQAEGRGGLTAAPLTEDHKPQLAGERSRIQRAGCRVVFDGYSHRIASHRGRLGLNMSRSLGDADAHNECGVSSHPDVSVRPLAQDDRALLVASDGLWEVTSPQEAADVVAHFGQWQPMEAARALADEARARWMKLTGGHVVDDITVVLAWFQDTIARTDTESSGSTMASWTTTASHSEQHDHDQEQEDDTGRWGDGEAW